jgi:hypothetical protein
VRPAYFNRVLVGFLLVVTAGCSSTLPHLEPYRDVSCFGRAKVPLLQAILTAENFRGERAVDGEFNITREMGCLSGDPGHYDIVFFTKARLGGPL